MLTIKVCTSWILFLPKTMICNSVSRFFQLGHRQAAHNQQRAHISKSCSTSTNVLLWWRHFRTPIESILSLYTELLKVQHVKNGINLLILSTAVAPTWAPILVSHLLSESSCYQATSLSTTRSFGLYCLWFTLIQSGWNCRGVNEAFDIFPVELGNGPVVNLSVSLQFVEKFTGSGSWHNNVPSW